MDLNQAEATKQYRKDYTYTSSGVLPNNSSLKHIEAVYKFLENNKVILHSPHILVTGQDELTLALVASAVKNNKIDEANLKAGTEVLSDEARIANLVQVVKVLGIDPRQNEVLSSLFNNPQELKKLCNAERNLAGEKPELDNKGVEKFQFNKEFPLPELNRVKTAKPPKTPNKVNVSNPTNGFNPQNATTFTERVQKAGEESRARYRAEQAQKALKTTLTK